MLWFAFKFVPLNHWKQPTRTAISKRVVVICFQICTFEPLETTIKHKELNDRKLWFAFKFVPLNHWKQQNPSYCLKLYSCDLLSNLYLWTIGNNFILGDGCHYAVVICFQICTFEPLETTRIVKYSAYVALWFAFKFVPLNHWKQQQEEFHRPLRVVICFQICTFEPLETTHRDININVVVLWFAFKFVPLNHWKQHQISIHNITFSCDLLSNLYLWTIGNNKTHHIALNLTVVICFQICTFEPLETTMYERQLGDQWLWFAFKFVPLNHWKQHKGKFVEFFLCCDLLSNLYLWTIGNNTKKLSNRFITLWFAFKFVPLNHWKQHENTAILNTIRCDLLSNLYLWTIGNNKIDTGCIPTLVVICFQICTFEPLETTHEEKKSYYFPLWFAFKFVPLNHWKQQSNSSSEETSVVICFQICTFEPLETTANRSVPNTRKLWFAFKFVPLNHWKQPNINNYLFINYLVIQKGEKTCFQ